MRHLVIRVDFDHGTVSLLRAVPRESGVQVTLDDHNPCPVVKGSIRGISRDFILDTGCHIYGAGGMSNEGFERLLRRGELETIDDAPVESDFDLRMHRVGILTVPLCIGGFKHRGISLTDLGEAAAQENILGVGYLRRYTVTFDFPNKTVYFKPGANLNQIDASRELGGLRLRRVNNCVMVSGLGWKSPAAAAGVRINDLLKTINGRDASAADDVELVRQLSHRTERTSLVFYRQSSGECIEYCCRINERGVTELCAPTATAQGKQSPGGSKLDRPKLDE